MEEHHDLNTPLLSHWYIPYNSISFVIFNNIILKCYTNIYDAINTHFFALDKSFLKDLTFQDGFDFLKVDDLFGISGCWVLVRSFMLGSVIIEFYLTVDVLHL